MSVSENAGRGRADDDEQTFFLTSHVEVEGVAGDTPHVKNVFPLRPKLFRRLNCSANDMDWNGRIALPHLHRLPFPHFFSPSPPISMLRFFVLFPNANSGRGAKMFSTRPPLWQRADTFNELNPVTNAMRFLVCTMRSH